MNYVIAAFTACLMVAMPAHAEWNKVFDVEYVMGDGDNRASARQSALEQLKLKASGEAGTYIQTTTTLQNGDLTESVQMIGASMIKVSDVQDKMSVNAGGQAVLAVTARATIDESELKRRVESMRQDKEKARQINILKGENDAMRRDLAEIRIALTGKIDAGLAAELIARQDATIRRLSEHDRTITQVFERGTLLQLASMHTNELARAKTYLDDNFLSPLLKTPVTAVIESVEDEGNGGYVALVRIGWELDLKSLNPVLAQYLNVSKGSGDNENGMAIRAYDNLDGKGPHVLSEKLYGYLSTKGVDLEINLAGKKMRFPVFYVGNQFGGTCGMYGTIRGNNKYLCVVAQNAKSAKIHSFDQKGTNPMRIPLTRDEAERATRVEASLVTLY